VVVRVRDTWRFVYEEEVLVFKENIEVHILT